MPGCRRITIQIGLEICCHDGVSIAGRSSRQALLKEHPVGHPCSGRIRWGHQWSRCVRWGRPALLRNSHPVSFGVSFLRHPWVGRRFFTGGQTSGRRADDPVGTHTSPEPTIRAGSSRNQVGPQSELDCVPVGHLGGSPPVTRSGLILARGRAPGIGSRPGIESGLRVSGRAPGIGSGSGHRVGSWYRAGLRASGRVLVSSRAPDIESGLHPDIAGVCEKCRQVDGEGTGVTIVQRC